MVRPVGLKMYDRIFDYADVVLFTDIMGYLGQYGDNRMFGW